MLKKMLLRKNGNKRINDTAIRKYPCEGSPPHDLSAITAGQERF
jgi:hypothetical protein